jgi:hypothetical protein
MNQSKHLNIVIIFALLMQILFFQVAIPSLVLCFGEDGHIAFEWKNDTGQYKLEEPIQLTDFNKDVIEKPETECTDINLYFYVSFAKKSKNKNYSTIITERLIQNYNSVSESTNKYSFIKLHHTTEKNHNLDTIQNTVLII